jgi:hypothetical protein
MAATVEETTMRTSVVSGNAWCREVRRVLLLADQREVYLDREALIHCDVRDLQRLSAQLQTRSRWPHEKRRRPW